MPNNNGTCFHKVGADPEFEVVDRRGGVVYASEVLPNEVSSTRDRSGGVGIDGASNVGEISVEPGSPITVMNSIRERLNTLAVILPPGYDARGGSGIRYPIGGHVHFDQAVYSSPSLLNRLDEFIGMPLNWVSDGSMRRSHGYGQLGEARQNAWGWEYRSPPSWLAHPVLAKGVLIIASLLAHLEKNGGALPRTESGLLRRLGSKHVKGVEAFYGLIQTYRESNIKLESLSVFESWGIRKRNNGNNNHEHEQHQVRWDGDYLDDICQSPPLRECRLPLCFVGARESRTPVGERAVFFNRDSDLRSISLLSRLLHDIGVMVMRWDVSDDNCLGLSMSLRRDTSRCRLAIETIIRHMNLER